MGPSSSKSSHSIRHSTVNRRSSLGFVQDCSNLVIRLGGFHTALNFLRCIGQHFTDSGLKDIWIESDLYNECTAAKILEGKHWNRAIRAHKLTFEALWRCLWPRFLEWQPPNTPSVREPALAAIVKGFKEKDVEAARSALKDVNPRMRQLELALTQFESSQL